MTGSKIGYRGTVQCEGRAKEGRGLVAGRRKVPQPHRGQLQRHAILRRPLRFASGLRLWIDCEICLAAAEAISLADSTINAGHSKAAHANCELFNPYMSQGSNRIGGCALR
jgi:hypothetical protein